MRYLVLIPLLLFLLAEAMPAPAAGLEDKLSREKARIKSVERELKQKRAALKQVEGRQRSTTAELKALEQELSGLRGRLGKLEADRTACETECRRAETELAALRPQVSRLRCSLSQRLVCLADTQPECEAAALFGPEHPSVLDERAFYLARLAEAEAGAAAAKQSDAQRLEQVKQQLDRERQKLASLGAEVARQKAAIEAKQAEKARLLASLGRERQDYARDTKRLEGSRRAMRGLIEELENKLLADKKHEPGAPPPVATTGFAALKGKLPLPVAGRVVSRFGQRDSMGIASTGIDIEAGGGSPINCVWKGRVAYAGLLKGYGNLVIIDHGDGYYTLYGRAGRLLKKVGQGVDRGEVLGTLAEGSGALYFEIRHRRQPQDPLSWLAATVAVRVD